MLRQTFLLTILITCCLGDDVVAQDTPAKSPEKQSSQDAATKPKSTSTKKPNTKKPRSKKKPEPFAWVNPLPKTHHPALAHKTFQSLSLGVDVGYCILLPPDYEGSPAVRFPVVYYLHGGRPGSEAKSHSLAAKIHKIQKAGEVSPVIYVFVNGGPVSHYNMPDDPKSQGADVFVKELIPHIDKTYRTISNRAGRGLEGFSQGGRGTMRISLRHPELFCSAAAGGGGYETEKKISESGGFENPKLKFAKGDNTWDLARRYAESEKPPVSWMVYVGTDGFNYKNNLLYMSYLHTLKIPFQKLIVPDVPHSGSKIYEQEGRRIMQFHAANFVKASTIDSTDSGRGRAIQRQR